MHKILRKMTSFLVAFFMVLSMITPAFAAEVNVSKAENATTKKVTLHKLLMNEKQLSEWDEKGPKGYDGTQNLDALKQLASGKDIKEIKDVYFAWQKKDDSGDWKYIDKDGKILEKQPEKNTTEAFQEVFGKKTEDTGADFDTSKLPQDKATEYRIVEIRELSTYKSDDGKVLADSKAVPVYITLPLANKDGVVLNAHVYPKNTEDKPKIDKNFKKAVGKETPLTAVEGKDTNNNINSGANYGNWDKDKATAKAEIGKKIPYEVKTKLNAGTEYKKITWTDTMTNGLTFNKDLQITITPENLQLDKNNDYKLTQDDRGFTLALTDAGLKKIAEKTKPVDENGKSTGKGSEVEFTLTYSATVNKNAVVDIPEKNDIKLDYGPNPGKEIEEKEVTPSEGKLNVKKTWGEGTDIPENASATFILKGNKKTYSVTLTKGMKTGEFHLGEDVIFKVTGEFTGTFEGLNKGISNWKISERVAGYTPEYTVEGDNGHVNITNKKDNDNPTPLNPTSPKVVVGGKRFVKIDNSEKNERLAGAKFVVKKENKYLATKDDKKKTAEQTALETAKQQLETAVKNYNERTDDKQESQLKQQVVEKQKAYNDAFKKASIKYDWVDDKNNDKVVVLVSNDKGQFEITGLEYGSYKLEEIQAPKGYAARDDVEFTVEEGSYSKHEGGINYEVPSTMEFPQLDAQKVINKKITIPQTGGIGTIIFTVVGIVIMGLAGFVLIKNNKKDEELA